MKIAEYVYISEILRPKKQILFERIRQKKRIPILYCVTLPVWNFGVFEIYEYNQLLSDYYKGKSITIVGMAAGREDALVIVRRMVDALYKAGMLENAQSYFGGEVRL